ncbi:hypothetical protein CRENBAI_011043 [Crenichthys baileyi]|uniref:Uncharacterized protein n=1 Tax=Crenichthys baileyi TaxID=28760 RepID=A0AAV9RFS9_9TELE
MDHREDRMDRVPPSESAQYGGHEDQRYRCLDAPTSCCSSLKSAQSKEPPLQFAVKRTASSAESMEPPLQFALQRVDQQNSEVPSGPSAQQHQTQLDSIFMLLEDNIVTFMKNELKKIQKVLSPDDSESVGG